MSQHNVLPWGPHTWYTLHYVAMGYPNAPSEQDKLTYRTFIETLGHVLPCKRCTGHYAQHLANMPVTDEVLANSETLFAWTVQLHNAVNVKAGRKEWTVEEAKRHLLNLPSSPEGDKNQEDEQRDVVLLSCGRSKPVQWALVLMLLLCIALIAVYLFLGRA